MTTPIEQVTAVIPVYNDPKGIDKTLQALTCQSDEIREIIAVDNGSNDDTRDVIHKYADEHDNITLLVENEVQGSYAARNKGVKRATGDIFGFIDADETVEEDWIESALRTFQARDADYMGCNVELTLPRNPTLAARYDHHTGFPVKQYLEHQHFAPTCCLFVRRSVFEEVGLFDHRLVSGGDKEFGNRVYEAGYDMHFAENVTMYHPTRNTLTELVKKDRRVGRGLCQLQRYHPDRYGTPGIPPRPSGVKSPDPELEVRDRLAFGALSRALTGVRGEGYYREYLSGERRDDPGEIPRLDR